jgi:hypothetical protein
LSERESQKFRDEGFLDEITLAFRSNSPLANFTTPYRVTVRNTPREETNSNWHHGAYVNDSIQVKRLTLSLGVRWDYYNSFYPDQDIPESRFRDFFYAGVPLQTSVGPYSLPRTPYADNSFTVQALSGIKRYPALFAPRFGMSWDLAGNGKTVVKANWGRFYHNPGNASEDINPSASATATFDWLDCRNGTTPAVCSGNQFGDKQFTQNELGQFRTASGVGGTSVLIDPNLKDPYTDAMSLWFERELGNNMGFRFGYTFRTDGDTSDDVELARLHGLYSLPRTFVDPGVDGIAGNADDGPPITMWDIPGQAPASVTEERTVESIIATDRAVDLTFTKRMSNRFSLVTSYYFNWDRDFEFIQNPNDERFADQTVTNWNFKVFGTYQAAWGITATGSVRHQSGTPISRDVTLNGQPGQNITLTGNNAYEAEPNGAYRTDNVTVTDAKVERRFRFGGRSLSAFLDVFNIFNVNPANINSMTTIVGRPTVTLADGSRVQVQGFLRPSAIVPPRIFRIGARLNF